MNIDDDEYFWLDFWRLICGTTFVNFFSPSLSPFSFPFFLSLGLDF